MWRESRQLCYFSPSLLSPSHITSFFLFGHCFDIPLPAPQLFTNRDSIISRTNERTNVRVRSSVKVLRWPKIVCASVLYLLRAMRMLSCYLSLELELLIFEKVAAPCDIESLAPVHEGLAGHEFYTNGDVSTFSPGFRNHSITVLSLKTVTL